MTTPEKSPAGLNRRNMIGAGLGVLGGAATLSALAAAPAQAVAVNALYTGIDPVRVADSRRGIGTAASKITSGQTRTIDFSDLDLPILTLISVVVNLTVTETVGHAWLRLWDGGTPPFTSNINWWGSGQIHANTVIVGLSTDNEMSVYCGDSGAATHFVIDLLGYFVGPGLPNRKEG
jgi:hypothetical protein